MRAVLAILIFLGLVGAGHAEQFSVRCEDAPDQPLLFTFDMAAGKAIYESPVRDPLPGVIRWSRGRSALFSVQMIGETFTDFEWHSDAGQMRIGLRGTPFFRTFTCGEIPLRPVTALFETLWPKP
jgi:hypothetical protein